MPDCEACDRCFVNFNALNNHLEHSRQHNYCFRCSRDFVSTHARQQHLANSSNHHLCQRDDCDLDFPSEDDLVGHLHSIHHMCISCGNFFGNEYTLRNHRVEYHNMCEHCEQEFDTEANLKAHLGSHRPRTIECYGCYKKFKSLSAMVLHLEYGGQCESESDADYIEELARECYASSHYLNYSNNDVYYPFECPCCNVVFKHMSGLLQHVESDRCEEDAEEGTPLGDFLDELRYRLG